MIIFHNTELNANFGPHKEHFAAVCIKWERLSRVKRHASAASRVQIVTQGVRRCRFDASPTYFEVTAVQQWRASERTNEQALAGGCGRPSQQCRLATAADYDAPEGEMHACKSSLVKSTPVAERGPFLLQATRESKRIPSAACC